MIEIISKITEAYVSPQYLLITIPINLAISLIVGYIVAFLTKEFIENAVIWGALIAVFITCIIYAGIHFGIRPKVHDYRERKVVSVFSSLDPSVPCAPSFERKEPILSWKEGLKKISKCPKEVGYYIATIKLLDKEKDSDSAVVLLELGLDFIPNNDKRIVICHKLQKYYRKLNLKNRPKLKECTKIIEIK